MKKIICFECGCIIDEGNEIWVNSEQKYICDDCYNDNYVTCDICGDVIHCNDYIYAHDEIYCRNCYDDNHTPCANCGEMIHNSATYSTIDGGVCEYCYDNYYVECSGCGDIIHRDNAQYDDYDDCYYCCDCIPDRAIQSYLYKPEPIFNGDSNLYMGVELEVDGGGYDECNAQKILDIEPLVYCKYDGSLNDGFEIVSHPCDLDYHINTMKWREILQKCVDMGYTSHNAQTCGLHIHISKNALGNTSIQQDKTISNILYFTEHFYDKLLKFSRRNIEQLERWAKRYGLESDEKPLDLLDKAKKCRYRYQMVNLTPCYTIEFRLFRGTLKYNTFIATLQFVKLICDMCKNLSNNEIVLLKWENVIFEVEQGNYTELKQYLIERGIY